MARSPSRLLGLGIPVLPKDLAIPAYSGPKAAPAWSSELEKVDPVMTQMHTLISPKFSTASIFRLPPLQTLPYLLNYSKVKPQEAAEDPHTWELARKAFERNIPETASLPQRQELWNRYIRQLYVAEWWSQNRSDDSDLYTLAHMFVFNTLFGVAVVVLLVTGLPVGNVFWKLLMADPEEVDMTSNWKLNLSMIIFLREASRRGVRRLRRGAYNGSPFNRRQIKVDMKKEVEKMRLI